MEQVSTSNNEYKATIFTQLHYYFNGELQYLHFGRHNFTQIMLTNLNAFDYYCNAYLIFKAWREGIPFYASGYTDTCRHDMVSLGIQITEVQIVNVTEVWFWMLQNSRIQCVTKIGICAKSYYFSTLL